MGFIDAISRAIETFFANASKVPTEARNPIPPNIYTGKFCTECGKPIYLKFKVIRYDPDTGEPANYEVRQYCGEDNLHSIHRSREYIPHSTYEKRHEIGWEGIQKSTKSQAP